MKSILYNSIAYYSIRILMFPISLLSYSAIHVLGKGLGSIAYYLSPQKRRKVTYNNLALAKSLNLNEREIKKIAKESYQNLIINSLEYFRLKRSRYKMQKHVTPINNQHLIDFSEKKKGVICVTGHISNWELCFLDHSQKYPLTAIGKKIKNKKLYDFIQSVRTMHGGEIIDMKNAISHAIKKLKEGATFSMVNDQAFTSSSYSYPFFGARAWTSAAPALMAYKANVPIISVATKRLPHGKYEYVLSDPIWPDTKKPLKQEVKKMMDILMADFEKAIKNNPGQWLWQHKRWKQEGYNYIWEQYKADSILFILPSEKKVFDWINEGVWIIPQIYPKTFLTFMVPANFKNSFALKKDEVLTYKQKQDLFIKDYRFQLIFDFTNNKAVKKHFFKLGAHSYYDLQMIKKRDDQAPHSISKFAYTLSHKLCLAEAKFSEPTA